ncbi:unnamed protein product [Sphenostylis stenocarpa]|uniref:Uncharacterized protein n=1 Tax=Sphenostylis stenocarpa TaxID=92480 RepID=A0AA86T516_9FABA|nr:unnamed protein product [Sphenostylis stenocarpa]
MVGYSSPPPSYTEVSLMERVLLLLRAKRSDDDEEPPYVVIVQHYFMTASCSKGVSAVAKIFSDSSDEGFSVELEKPSKKSKRELLSMFDDIEGKGWWPDPTTLPSCAIDSLSTTLFYDNTYFWGNSNFGYVDRSLVVDGGQITWAL